MCGWVDANGVRSSKEDLKLKHRYILDCTV